MRVANIFPTEKLQSCNPATFTVYRVRVYSTVLYCIDYGCKLHIVTKRHVICAESLCKFITKNCVLFFVENWNLKVETVWHTHTLGFMIRVCSVYTPSAHNLLIERFSGNQLYDSEVKQSIIFSHFRLIYSPFHKPLPFPSVIWKTTRNYKMDAKKCDAFTNSC